MTLSPKIMFILCVAVGLVLVYLIDCKKTSCGSINHYPLSKKVGSPLYLDILKIALVFDLALVLISFSAFFAPDFFKEMNYTVSNNSFNIDAFEATNLFVSSVLAVVIGYMSVEMAKK